MTVLLQLFKEIKNNTIQLYKKILNQKIFTKKAKSAVAHFAFI